MSVASRRVCNSATASSCDDSEFKKVASRRACNSVTVSSYDDSKFERKSAP